MVRSKRKWKKDSPEKLTERIEKQLVQLRKMPQKEITSPENKKSKNANESATESSSAGSSGSSLFPLDPQSEKKTNNSEPITNNSDHPSVMSEKSEETQSDPEILILPEVIPNPQIENALSAITHSLHSLAQTVAGISTNMVSKSDIDQLRNIIQVEDKQIADNTDKIKKTMSKEDGKKLERKRKDHDSIMKTQAEDMERIETNIKDAKTTMTTITEEVNKTGNRIDGLADLTRKQNSNIQNDIENMRKRLDAQEAEIQTLKNGQHVNILPCQQQKPLDNIREHTHDTRLNIVIEGLREDEGENLDEKIRDLCKEMGINLKPDEIVSAWRLERKVPIKGKPNPVKICFSNHVSKEKIMYSKYKLKKNPETQYIWINHDEPTLLRRAKGRARFIASYSRKKGSEVQITHSGIVIDSVFYSYDNLGAIPSIYIPPKSLQVPVNQTVKTSNNMNDPLITVPEKSIPVATNRVATDIHTPTAARAVGTEVIELMHTFPKINQHRSPKSPTPRTKKTQKMRLTRAGLVYSGPTAIFSHLYRATFTIDDTPYNSVEQKLQYEKAMMAKDLQAAEQIMNTHDTWRIKQIGDLVKVTKEYIENRLHIARIGNEAKYRDNHDLMEALIETGDLKLIEGATSSFWAGGELYNSEAYDNDDAHGKNHQGNMVMNLRDNEIRRRSRQAQQ